MSLEEKQNESTLTKESFDAWIDKTVDNVDALDMNSILTYFNLRYGADQTESRLNQLFNEPDSPEKEKETRELTTLIKQTGRDIIRLQKELESNKELETVLKQCEEEYSKIKIQ